MHYITHLANLTVPGQAQNRSRSNGIVGHVPPEIAVTMVRNTQLEEIRRRMIDFQALSPEDRILSKVGEPEITLREAVTTASRRHAV